MLELKDVMKGVVYHKNFCDFIIVINHDKLKDVIYYLKGKFTSLSFETSCYCDFIVSIKNGMDYQYNISFTNAAIEAYKCNADDRTIKLIEFFGNICCFDE